MLRAAVCVCALAAAAECAHVFGIDKDFNKINHDEELRNSLSSIVKRLRMFKAHIHPRIRFFYTLLRRGMALHAAARADSLYVPDKYNLLSEPEPEPEIYYEDDNQQHPEKKNHEKDAKENEGNKSDSGHDKKDEPDKKEDKRKLRRGRSRMLKRNVILTRAPNIMLHLGNTTNKATAPRRGNAEHLSYLLNI